MSATVFIVEDDVDTREMLGRFLELEGYRVEKAANGHEESILDKPVKKR